MSKSSLRLTANAPGVGPPISKALILPARSSAALGEGDQRAGERLAGRHDARAPRCPCWRGRLDKAGGTAIGSPRASTPIAAEVEADDAMDALDADIEHVAVDGERLGVVPAARRQRPPVGAEHRRHHGVGDADRTTVAS